MAAISNWKDGRPPAAIAGGGRGGPPVPLFPGHVPNLEWWVRSDGQLWTDLDREVPATLEGEAVAVADDYSGHERHAVQASAPARPALHLGAVGALPSLELNGSSDWMAADEVAAIAAGTDTPFTVLIAARLALPDESECLCSFADPGSAKPRMIFILFPVLDLLFVQREDDDTGSANAQSLEAVAPGWHVFVFQFSGTTITASVDGVVVIDGAAMNVGVCSFTGWAIGADNSITPQTFFGGSLSEVLVYSGLLEAEQLEGLARYLVSRWTP